ncbi:hypothetical protein HMPREF1551_02658 [Capnocytophaga sp. oral taxon 863 str. F0517]|nr:hypothetical protein HMPREF1551_02658 [Capnocytophaga sp. oral taxon 863 str. F0517]
MLHIQYIFKVKKLLLLDVQNYNSLRNKSNFFGFKFLIYLKN